MPRGSSATPRRRLSADEEHAWRAYAIGAHLLFDQLDRELQRDSGLTQAYYSILMMLSDQPGYAVRMVELATALCYSPSRVSESMLRLEKRGWVRREPSPDDGRGTLAVLTDAGLAALEAARPGHVQNVRRHLFDHLSTDQVSQLREISQAIAAPLMAAAGFDRERIERAIRPRSARAVSSLSGAAR